MLLDGGGLVFNDSDCAGLGFLYPVLKVRSPGDEEIMGGRRLLMLVSMFACSLLASIVAADWCRYSVCFVCHYTVRCVRGSGHETRYREKRMDEWISFTDTCRKNRYVIM